MVNQLLGGAASGPGIRGEMKSFGWTEGEELSWKRLPAAGLARPQAELGRARALALDQRRRSGSQPCPCTLDSLLKGARGLDLESDCLGVSPQRPSKSVSSFSL